MLEHGNRCLLQDNGRAISRGVTCARSRATGQGQYDVLSPFTSVLCLFNLLLGLEWKPFSVHMNHVRGVPFLERHAKGFSASVHVPESVLIKFMSPGMS